MIRVSFIVLLVGDVLASVPLVFAGLYALRSWKVLRHERTGANYWRLTGIGLIYLAFDELFGVHELIANGLGLLGVPLHPPVFNHLNDAILFTYAFAGLTVSCYYARELFRHKSVLIPLALAVVTIGASMGVDGFAAHSDRATAIEEGLEIPAAFLFAVAFRILYTRTMRPVPMVDILVSSAGRAEQPDAPASPRESSMQPL